MPLFHPRIIEKHIKSVKPASPEHLSIVTAWAENVASGIYNSETKNDGQFIQRILVELLGYKESNAASPWTVQKNQPVGKGNVDVALGSFNADTATIIAPFELKGAKTRDLDAVMAGRNKSPVQQAWEYAMDAKGAKWVLVSNYREIRLYAVGYGRKDYERFDLTQLVKPEEYARFMLLLLADNLLGERTFGLLKESENKDKEITDKLYQDYKTLRSRMIETLTKDNPAVPVLDIIQHTQTILDRILFVAFAEDRGLLPDDTLKRAYDTRNAFNPQPVWGNFKGLFQAIDKGSPPLNITGYNGGLFANNDHLNSLFLSDALCEGFRKIGEYDFESDVSVNILGHIFEQSITDLEEIKANASGAEDFDKKKSKRKKDGIFYTPPYITRYIVEQAVGGWLNDRKQEIGFDKLPELTDDDYASIKIVKKSVRYNAKIKKHIKAWEAYKEALSNVKVLDPACGSGAFLNEVFDYLYREGQIVNSELTTLNANQAQLFRWDKHILANNIYGVDINQESVEITKLSLWLKTANKGEKLTYLDNNIKCGNSLIDDPAVAGTHAFKWEAEFAGIMQAGGFDVIVGNPPYGAALSETEKQYIKTRYLTTEYNFETYVSFFELTINHLVKGGYYGVITPNTFLVGENSIKVRNLLFNSNSLISLLEVFNVFQDAIVEPIITVGRKEKSNDKDVISIICTERTTDEFADRFFRATSKTIKLSDLKKDKNLLFNFRASRSAIELANKLKANKKLCEIASVTTGVKPYQTGKGVPPQTRQIVDEKPFTAFERKTDDWKPVVRGTDVNRYIIYSSNEYIHYGNWLAEPRSQDIFYTEKLLIRRTDDSLMCSYDSSNMIGINSVHSINAIGSGEINLLCLMVLINSKLLNWHFQHENFHMVGKPLAEVKVVFVERLPIRIPDNQTIFIKKAETMLSKNNELHEISSKFLALLKSEFALEKPSTKLEQWYTLTFAEFTVELTKKKIALTVSQKAEWMEYFEKQKAIASAIKTTIDTTDHEIDQMVYTLYGLTSEEIAVVEGKT